MDQKELQGLGGWLILVGIGVIIAPFYTLFQAFLTFQPIFSEGIWEILTTPGSDAYHPLWQPILIGEIVINVSLVLVLVYIVFLFFSKKRSLPSWYVAVLLFTPIFIAADAFALKLILPNEPVFDPETTRNFAQSAIGAAIWVPYMLVSKRVKATFVN
jgi:hypothetical protein